MPNAPDHPVEPTGLPDEHVDRLFHSLKRFSNLAIAVSGGADSLCLLVLLSEWRKRQDWPGTLEVLCVDHGLRPESGAEADFVARCAQKLALDCTVLFWPDTRPGSNLQEEARQARYRLMAEHISKTGAEALVLGHHLDDQAETFLDRLTRGSGTAGLSAMAQDEPFGPCGLRLLRPMLSIRKSQLEASLTQRGQPWCSDSSNKDPKYKRTRLRQMMALLDAEGLSVDRLARTADNMRRAELALSATLHDFVTQHVVDHVAGPLKVPRALFAALPDELRLRLLSLMISRVTGVDARPRLRQLVSADEALRDASSARAPLSGALFESNPEFLFCWREPGRRPPETLIGVAAEGIWDHRYRFSADFSGNLPVSGPLYLGPLRAAPISSKSISWPVGWPKDAFGCAPVIWSSEGILKMPGLDVETGLVNFCRCEELELERLPFQAKLRGNYDSEGGAELEN